MLSCFNVLFTDLCIVAVTRRSLRQCTPGWSSRYFEILKLKLTRGYSACHNFFMYNRTTTWESTTQTTESICLIWRPRLTTRRCKLDWSPSKWSFTHLYHESRNDKERDNKPAVSIYLSKFEGSRTESLEIMETPVSHKPDISLARHQRIGQPR